MPLELVNHSKNTITLVPFIPICQLMLIQLSQEPSRIYGVEELFSKYLDDEGGPSYWWKDKRIKALHAALGEHDVAVQAHERIMKLSATQDPDVIERLDEYVSSLKKSKITNADEVLSDFAAKEDKRRTMSQIMKGFCGGVPSVMAATALGSLFTRPYNLFHYIFWAAAAVSQILWIFVFQESSEYFGRREYDRAQKEISHTK